MCRASRSRADRGSPQVHLKPGDPPGFLVAVSSPGAGELVDDEQAAPGQPVLMRGRKPRAALILDLNPQLLAVQLDADD